jgi:hypothetical protein
VAAERDIQCIFQVLREAGNEKDKYNEVTGEEILYRA